MPPLTAAVLLQFWKEVVEDAEVRELIWDKNSPAQGKQRRKAIKGHAPLRSHRLFIDT